MSSGVPDGLNKTADWSEASGALPVSPGAPNLNTTDWTDRPMDPELRKQVSATTVIPSLAREQRAARLEARTGIAAEPAAAPSKTPMMIAAAAIVLLLLVVAVLGAMLLLK
jgi:hypothetical protein